LSREVDAPPVAFDPSEPHVVVAERLTVDRVPSLADQREMLWKLREPKHETQNLIRQEVTLSDGTLIVGIVAGMRRGFAWFVEAQSEESNR